MKKKINHWYSLGMSIAFILCSFVTYGQRIKQDVFNDLVYEAGRYNAKLKKNVFDDLTFTDSNHNTLKFNKAYLQKKMGANYNELDVKSMFFQDLILDYMQISGYEATYGIDILGKLTIEDNRGKKLTAKEDVFGILQVKNEGEQKSWDIQTDFSGDMTFKGRNESATLTKNFTGNRVYTDSNSTKIEVSALVWERLVKKNQTEQGAFIQLIEQFLLLPL
ncbi:hypothetical protein [Myroides odoratus]|uniref:Uncharacterized protein n=1 Tax=Myroides odoratus TaxID=256 RepID=A0A378RJX6_MYROD|nr:hypothetical protein [Myroides odoratus]QQU05196.1 hypothetical protein I6I89_07930 [Myroides odoratus]STZ27312.1 Uncharacterised protein [Myroides odoratus]